MNRFPAWKYALIGLTIIVAFLYTLPNFYGESPAVQITSAKATVKVDDALAARVGSALKSADIQYTGALLDPSSLRVRFADTDAQLKAKDLISKTVNPDPSNSSYVVALNLLTSSPSWLTAIHALPMYLGLDLRGGVHFLLQVDMQAALAKHLEGIAGELRRDLRDKDIRYHGIERDGDAIKVRFSDPAMRARAEARILTTEPDLSVDERDDGKDLLLVATFKPSAAKSTEERAIKQNITTLHNRVNELGVAEPIIQQQGADRVVVSCPACRTPRRQRKSWAAPRPSKCGWWTKRRCAAAASWAMTSSRSGTATALSKWSPSRSRSSSPATRSPMRRQPSTRTTEPAVSVQLNDAGGAVMRQVTRENLHHRMAIILFEKGKGEAISVARIQGEFGSRVPDHGQLQPDGDRRPVPADACRLARGTDGYRGGAHRRPEPGQGKHP